MKNIILNVNQQEMSSLKPTSSLFHCQVELNGEMWIIIATEQGVCRIIFPHEDLEHWASWFKKHSVSGQTIESYEMIENTGVIDQLQRYFAGEVVHFDTIPLDLRGTAFQKKVWSQLQQVTYGTLCTYGDLAVALDNPSATRAVGTAIGANPLPIILACHRIVGKDGRLTGFRGGLRMKQQLLQIEGITAVKEGGHERFQF
ncbi:methylated-DNA--[protein]-cysteine S-methyltransferase [Paenibacillus yanchengensis]|uniref:Methylated-DNA--[protein]-cysteine S-methyltransferase n=1 Tax=Paenibacillus yanchengensis TaxID=2035833 RepID=A0ABW4YMK2_9BACL